jgi:hypothetical protein
MKEKKDFLNACSFAKENAVGSSPTPRTNLPMNLQYVDLGLQVTRPMRQVQLFQALFFNTEKVVSLPYLFAPQQSI